MNRLHHQDRPLGLAAIAVTAVIFPATILDDAVPQLAGLIVHNGSEIRNCCYGIGAGLIAGRGPARLLMPAAPIAKAIKVKPAKIAWGICILSSKGNDGYLRRS